MQILQFVDQIILPNRAHGTFAIIKQSNMFQMVHSLRVEHDSTAKSEFIRLVFKLLTIKFLSKTSIV